MESSCWAKKSSSGTLRSYFGFAAAAGALLPAHPIPQPTRRWCLPRQNLTVEANSLSRAIKRTELGPPTSTRSAPPKVPGTLKTSETLPQEHNGVRRRLSRVPSRSIPSANHVHGGLRCRSCRRTDEPKPPVLSHGSKIIGGRHAASVASEARPRWPSRSCAGRSRHRPRSNEGRLHHHLRRSRPPLTATVIPPPAPPTPTPTHPFPPPPHPSTWTQDVFLRLRPTPRRRGLRSRRRRVSTPSDATAGRHPHTL